MNPPVPPDDAGKRRDLTTLAIIALCLVIACASWFLLQQLAMLLRPLLMAVFLAYIILPIHHRLTQRIPRYAAFIVMAGGSMAIIYGLALLIYSSAVDLTEDMDRYVARGRAVTGRVNDFVNTNLPWLRHDDGTV